MSLAATVIVGLGSFRYEVRERWGKLPEGWSFVEVTAVATDSQDRVYVFNRGEHPVIIFDRDGNVLGSWGEGMFVRPHGITIGPDETVYCTDDLDHTVKIFTLDGDSLRTLGTSGRPSDTGATSIDFRTIRHAGPPFHYPTNLALAPSGEMYVTDGYGNARVHKFASRRPPAHLLGRAGERPRAVPRPARDRGGPPGHRLRRRPREQPPPALRPRRRLPRRVDRPGPPLRGLPRRRRQRVRRRARLPRRDVARHDRPEPRRAGGPREHLRSHRRSCSPAGAAATTPARRATSSPRTTSGSTRGATSTSPK